MKFLYRTIFSRKYTFTHTHTDWSGDANTIGGVLSQKQAGREKVIAYGAQKLSQSQQNYAPTKGELWAIVHFCRYWRYFLQHRSVPFIIRTDHQSIQYS
jgi:hypothetical protein